MSNYESLMISLVYNKPGYNRDIFRLIKAFTYDNLTEAVANNDYEAVLGYSYKDKNPCLSYNLMKCAIQTNNNQLITYIFENYEVETHNIISYAARCGNLEIMKYFHDKCKSPYICSVLAMDEAARIGRLDILVWLHNNRTEGCTFAAMIEASRKGHLDVVKWLHINRHENNMSASLECAIQYRQYDVLDYLYKNHKMDSINILQLVFVLSDLKIIQIIYTHNPQLLCTKMARYLCEHYGSREIGQFIKHIN